MTTSLQDSFLHIADSEYRGEDHCELVGTDREYTPNINVELENTFLTGGMFSTCTQLILLQDTLMKVRKVEDH